MGLFRGQLLTKSKVEKDYLVLFDEFVSNLNELIACVQKVNKPIVF